MLRHSLLLLALISCSPKAPASTESKSAAKDVGLASPGAAAEALPAPDPREKALSAVVLQLLEEEHLLRKRINDDVSREAFDAYIEALDAGKMFLLKTDRDALAKHIDKIDDELRAGSLDLAHEGSKTFVARVGVVEKVVQELLDKPMDFTNEEYVEIDPEKTTLAANEADLKDRWRKRLELEVLERVAQMEARLKAATDPKSKDAKDKDNKDNDDEDTSAPPVKDIPATAEARETKARADLAKTYSARFARLKTPGPLDAASELINALVSVLDPHTSYLPPADKANFDIRMSGSLEGIGAVLREKEHLIEIVEIVPGGASWRQGGLKQGDLILSVQQEKQDPVDVFDMRIDDVVKMIRGPKGTVVRLRVQKPAGGEETIAITRDVVVIEEAYAKGAVIQNGGKSYGYIHLPSFYGGKGSPRTSSVDLKKLFHEMKEKKVGGVVLDIRSNGGGLLSDSIDITGLLIDKGPVVQVQDSDGQKEVLSDKKSGVEYDGPVVVLVDRFSASASEILAGALQDYGRAVIVGTGPTHGKGTVQTLADLDRATGGKIELGVLKITIQQFFRPSGSSNQREGIKPDILLPDPAAYVEAGEASLKHAIPWSQISPAPFDKWPVQYNVGKLAEKSATRVAKSPILTKIGAATAILKQRRNDTKVPLMRTAWEKRRAEQKAALDAASPDLKNTPAKMTVKPLEDSPAPATAPGPGGKADDRPAKWRDSIARDPWVEESIAILGDMVGTK
ncbi:MAG TPA: carboxy terminal-processing peptidase [Kofleriaceae bacterium]